MSSASRRGNFRGTLVTGGAGFVGAHLVHALCREGRKVVVADWQRQDIAGPLQLLGLCDLVDYVHVDLADYSAVQRAIPGDFDTIFHLAAQPIAPLSEAIPDTTVSCNVDTTRVVLDLLRQGRARQLVLASSACAFGVPQPEECPLKEDSAMYSGRYPYTHSKQWAERLVSDTGGRVAIARFVNLFGEADWHTSRIVPRIVRQLILGQSLSLSRSRGRTVLDFLHISDAIAALLSAEAHVAHRAAPVQTASVFNFGHGSPLSILQLIEEICMTFDGRSRTVAIPRSVAEPDMHKYLDFTFAKESLGWVPQKDRTSALRQTIEWYARYGSGLRDADAILTESMPWATDPTCLHGTNHFALEREFERVASDR
jgi:nucleoside-diphosphate-sugar epimerase